MTYFQRDGYGNYVALLAEGVDRNKMKFSKNSPITGSPSSRRAWIEIGQPECNHHPARRSPSSRRAWIEILNNYCE